MIETAVGALGVIWAGFLLWQVRRGILLTVSQLAIVAGCYGILRLLGW